MHLNKHSRKGKILMSNLTQFHLIGFDFVMVQFFFPFYFVSTNSKSILLPSLLFLSCPEFLKFSFFFKCLTQEAYSESDVVVTTDDWLLGILWSQG